VGGTCSAYGRNKKCMQILFGKVYLEELGVDKRIKLKWILNIYIYIWHEGFNYIHLVPDSDQWPDLLNTVMDLSFP